MKFHLYEALVRHVLPDVGEIAVFDRHGVFVQGTGGKSPSVATALLAGRAPGAGGEPRGVALGSGEWVLPLVDGDRHRAGWLHLARVPDTSLAELTRRLGPVPAVLAEALAGLESAAPARVVEAPRAFDTTVSRLAVAAVEHDPTEAVDDTLAWLARDLQAAGGCLYAPAIARMQRVLVRRVDESDAARLDGLVARLWEVIRSKPEPLLLNRVRLTQDAPLEPFRIACVPVHHRDGLFGLAFVWRSRSEPRFEQSELRRLEGQVPALGQALSDAFDPGTGLLTRGAFEARLVASRSAAPDRARCLVYVDVDRFHVVNEAVGFAQGDEVLRRVAECLAASELPADSFVGRLSGDRFIASLENCSVNGARLWVERAQDRLGAVRVADADVRLSISAGIAALPTADPVAPTLAAAETACRAAKDRGRARVEIYASTDASLIQRRLDLRVFKDLRTAFDTDAFELMAQPIFRLATPDAQPQYELLARMRAPDGSLVMPDQFLSAATRYQLLKHLDDWVLAYAASTIEEHGAFVRARRLRFWLNVSGQSLQDDAYAERARQLVKRSQLPPGTLNFEITENAAIGQLDSAKRFIRRLREVGSDVKLDDFGTGLCSLAYLKELNVAGVKIDGAFVRGLETDARASPVLSGVLHIARQVGLETTAECIESDAVVAKVASLGVDYGQGYALGRPAPLAELFATAARIERPGSNAGEMALHGA